MQPQPSEYTQPVQYTQPGQYPAPNQYAQPATQYVQPQPVQYVQQRQPMQQIPAQQMVYVTQDKSSNKVVPWIGVAIILVSLFMPYLSLGIFDVSGFELMGMVGEIGGDLADDDGSSDSDSDSGSSDVDLPVEFVFFGIAALMVGFGPIIFIISAITSALVLLLGKSPKAIGVLHMSYGLIFLVVALIGTIDFGISGSASMYDVTGFGFYIGAFASGLLFIK